MGTFNSTGSGGNWTDDATWAETGQPAADGTDHCIITAGDTVTLTGNTGTGSIKISGTIVGAGHTLTVNKSSSNKPFDHDGVIDSGSDLNVTITNTGAQQDGLLLDATPNGGASTGNINDLTINMANGTAANKTIGIADTLTLDGDLTITSGTLDTVFSSGSSQNLIVTGACTLNGGTFTGNASTVSHGSLTISSGTYNATNQTTTLNGTVDVGMRVDGTFNNNDGTFVIDGSITKVQMGSIGGAPTGFSINNAPFHHLTINDSINFAWGTGTLFNVEGDLIVAAGQTLGANNENSGIKVLGKVTLNGTLGNSNLTNDCEFGTLEVASGGEYYATSGTTTITTGGTVAGTGSMAFGGEGTFTHNNGTLVLDSTQHRMPAGGTFYNLTLNGEQTTDGIYAYTTTMLPQPTMPDGNTGAAMIHIKGTLQINHDEFRPYNTDRIWIHNLVIGDGTGSANSAKFDMSEADSFDGTVYVDNVTINSDGQFLFGDGDETSSTAGSSALNIYGSFRNLGGSVDIS